MTNVKKLVNLILPAVAKTLGVAYFLLSLGMCYCYEPQQMAEMPKKGAASILCNPNLCSKLEGVLFIVAGGPFISREDGRYVALLDFDKRELNPIFLKGVGEGYSPWAISPSRDKIFFEGSYKPPVINGKPAVPTFFESVYRIGEYDIATKKVRFLFEGPFLVSGFEYSSHDNLILFDATGWAESAKPENPFRDYVFKLDVTSGKVEKIIDSGSSLRVDAIAEGGRIFLLAERKTLFSNNQYLIYDYEGRRLKSVPVSYDDGVLYGRYLSSDGKRIAFTRESRIRSIYSFSVSRYARPEGEIVFIQGTWSEEYRRWFRGPHCFSPDGRYLILLFAKDQWPREYSEVTLVLYDLDTGEYDWLVKAEFAPTSLYLNWQQ